MPIGLEQLEKGIKEIHAAPQMVVIEFAGAGSQALAWLHGVSGSSRTILEVTDRYAAASVISAIGFEPDQFASPQVARAMATKAHIRACQLAGPGVPVAGIGCTATIATGRTKRGEHRCCLAVSETYGVTTYSLILTKGLRTRRQEEELVSLLILKAVAKVCGVDGLPELELFESEHLAEHFESVDLVGRLLAGEMGWVAVSPEGQMTPGETIPDIALLSGAFNPLHDGHKQLARVAGEILKRQVHFELPLINAGKGPLTEVEARRRVAQFADFATVILTRAPLFSQKAALFPHSVFVVGADSVERLLELRFYNNDPAQLRTALETIRIAGCRFLVAGRLHQDCFLTLGDIKLPQGYRELFEQIPADRFRVDISSSLIRDRGY